MASIPAPLPSDSAPRDRAYEPGRSATPTGARHRPSDWGSLVADLSPSSHRPEWRIHDRTHLEFALDYPLDHAKRHAVYEWEAYFFIPESLRVDASTYDKSDIYADLQSYVRFAVPDLPFSEVAQEPLARVQRVTSTANPEEIARELRLFACLVRASGVAARSAIGEALGSAIPDERARGLAACARMVADARRITQGLRDAVHAIPKEDDALRTASDWVDEDVSRLIETLMGSLSVRLTRVGAPEGLLASVTETAVAEARYRKSLGLDSVGRVRASKREVEHLEFRRHVLKRFTSSVLWLKPEVREGARLVLQVLYSLAAGVAMAFAVATALLNGDPRGSETLWMWGGIAVLAYIGKDRLKAMLQSMLSKVVLTRLPDRRWRVIDRERWVTLGKVDEQSAFVPFKNLPGAVLERRRSTRRHPLEEQARPEKVLWHRKVVRIDPKRVAQADDRFTALTEIFRLDLRRWLAHTDDPKRKIMFADPDEGRVLQAVAPRVYNIGIVYRLRRRGDNQAIWHRLRVVVSRKGIRRIDHIDTCDPGRQSLHSLTEAPRLAHGSRAQIKTLGSLRSSKVGSKKTGSKKSGSSKASASKASASKASASKSSASKAKPDLRMTEVSTIDRTRRAAKRSPKVPAKSQARGK